MSMDCMFVFSGVLSARVRSIERKNFKKDKGKPMAAAAAIDKTFIDAVGIDDGHVPRDPVARVTVEALRELRALVDNDPWISMWRWDLQAHDGTFAEYVEHACGRCVMTMQNALELWTPSNPADEALRAQALLMVAESLE